MEKTSSLTENAAHGLQKAADNVSSVLLLVMDMLAGTESDIKLSFEDLIFETGMIKARLNGAVVLSVVYASKADEESSLK